MSPARAAAGMAFLLLAGALPACQSEAKPQADVGSDKSASLRAMEQVAAQAYRCWFASKDPDFRPYGFANELDSMSGRPRFLLVPVKDFGGRPLLVVQAQGGSAAVETFGPLLAEPLGRRIESDIGRWSAGGTGCGAAA